MKFKIYSSKDDLLELNGPPVRPQLKLGELIINEVAFPWNAQCQNIVIKDFDEPYDEIKDKIQKFYSEEAIVNSNGWTVRKPGRACLGTEKDKYTMQNFKIIGCECNDETRTVVLEAAFDGIDYKLI